MKFSDFKKRAWLFSALFLIIIFTTYILLSYQQEKEIIKNEEIVLVDEEIIEEAEKEEYSPLLNPIAVVLDNYPNNLNLKGLNEAAVVYELPTEGGTSRFLAIFDNNNPNEFVVGPIRSLRKYFINFSADFQALLVHCGGSPDALASIANTKLSTLNEFYNGAYFKRDDSLKAPNNIYLKNTDWLSYLIDKDKERIEEDWLFKTEVSYNSEDFSQAENINSYYSSLYQANWAYNEQLEAYIREPYDLVAKTLIFHFVDTIVIDDVLRLKLLDQTEGKAIICHLAKCYNGIWKKEDKHRYYIDENEVFFEKALTWINVMPKFAKLSF